MKTTIIIGALIATISVLANLIAIYDNACKYAIDCVSTDRVQPNDLTAREILMVCNGRLSPMPNGALICEGGIREEGHDRSVAEAR
jgi:hypothetical protein